MMKVVYLCEIPTFSTCRKISGGKIEFLIYLFIYFHYIKPISLVAIFYRHMIENGLFWSDADVGLNPWFC